MCGGWAGDLTGEARPERSWTIRGKKKKTHTHMEI